MSDAAVKVHPLWLLSGVPPIMNAVGFKSLAFLRAAPTRRCRLAEWSTPHAESLVRRGAGCKVGDGLHHHTTSPGYQGPLWCKRGTPSVLVPFRQVFWSHFHVSGN
jgi:hypothetical protein